MENLCGSSSFYHWWFWRLMSQEIKKNQMVVCTKNCPKFVRIDATVWLRTFQVLAFQHTGHRPCTDLLNRGSRWHRMYRHLVASPEPDAFDLSNVKTVAIHQNIRSANDRMTGMCQYKITSFCHMLITINTYI